MSQSRAEQLSLWEPPTCRCQCGCQRERHPANLYCNRCLQALRNGWTCDGIDSPTPLPRRRRFRKGRLP